MNTPIFICGLVAISLTLAAQTKPADAPRIPQRTPNTGPAYGLLFAGDLSEAARSRLSGRACPKVRELPSSTPLWIDGAPVVMSEKEKSSETAPFHRPAGSETSSNLVGGYEEVSVGVRPRGKLSRDFDIVFDNNLIDKNRIGPVR